MDSQPTPRAQAVTPFLVMQLLDEAKAMLARGDDVIRFEAGEPDLPTPGPVLEGAQQALAEGLTGYTPSPGTTELREAICEWYQARYRVEVHPDRVVVTCGTSPALLLAMGAVVGRGDEVLIADPGYPGYTNAARFLEANIKRFLVREEESFSYSSDQIAELVTPATKVTMVNSPANPTGARVPPEELRKICSLGPWVISDEIYHGLCYESGRCHTALEYTDRTFVLNGFSKRYAMPGLRLGWVIVPETCVQAVRNMNMNFYLGAGSISQAAGLAALRHADADVERMRMIYQERRDLMVSRLTAMGFGVPARPAGAFYVFANAKRFSGDSIAFARELLNETKVSITPGVDFGPGSEGYLRFSYAVDVARIAEGMDRIARYLGERGG
jgi:aspartate/methionine/tyrosine aminotransferase